MRQQAFGHSRFYTNKQHRAALTKDELRQALEDSDRPEAQATLNRIFGMLVLSKERVPSGTGGGVTASRLPTVPGAFVTLSPADHHWHSL